MSKLQDMVAFGEPQDALPCGAHAKALRVLRASTRWVLACSLLGVAFSAAMAYREYGSPELSCAPLSPGSVVSPCMVGLALYALLAGVAAVALARTRGLGDELVDTSIS